MSTSIHFQYLKELIKFTITKFFFCVKDQEGFGDFTSMFVLIAKMSSTQICLWKVRKSEWGGAVCVNWGPQCFSSYCHNQKFNEKPMCRFNLKNYLNHWIFFLQMQWKTITCSLLLVKHNYGKTRHICYNYKSMSLTWVLKTVGFPCSSLTRNSTTRPPTLSSE